MKIVHVWDQCSYASNVTEKLNVKGFEFEQLRRLPEFGTASKFLGHNSRVASYVYHNWLLASVSRLRRTNCVFEIHTPHFYSLFPELANRTIFHAHGSEIRETVIGGKHIETVNELTRFALSESLATFYSTPELGPIVGKYAKSNFWTPHVVSLVSDENTVSLKENDLFIPSSWDTWKGSQEVLAVIRKLLSLNPKLRIIGMDFGGQKELAARLGVELLGTRSRAKFHDLIRSSNVVVGHGYGVLGATDLEAIYLGSAYFPFSPSIEWFEAYDFQPTDFPDINVLLEELQIMRHYLNSSLAGFRDKVKAVHNHSAIESRLKNAYSLTLN